MVVAVSSKGDDVIGPLVFFDPETGRFNVGSTVSFFPREALKYLHRAMNCVSASPALRLADCTTSLIIFRPCHENQCDRIVVTALFTDSAKQHEKPKHLLDLVGAGHAARKKTAQCTY